MSTKPEEHNETEEPTEPEEPADDGTPRRLRANEDGDDKRHASWLELLVDLVFYTVVGQLATGLAREPTGHGLFRFAALFVPVWWSWIGLAFFAARFDFDDVVHRGLVFLQTLAFAAMAVSVDIGNLSGGHGAHRGSYRAFALTYVAMRLILVYAYTRAGRRVKEARGLTTHYAIGFSVAAAVWLVSAFVGEPLRFFLWGLGQIMDCLTPFLGRGLQSKLPPDDEHLPERFGQLVLIVLGETVTLTIGAIDPQRLPFTTIGTVLVLSLTIAFGVWWAYFDAIDDRGGAVIAAASRDGKVGIYQTWLYAHLPLVMGITVGGVGTQWLLAASLGRPLTEPMRWMLCGSFALAIAGLLIVHLTRTAERRATQGWTNALRRAVGFKAAAIVALLAAGLWGRNLPPVSFLALAAAVSLGVIGLNIIGRRSEQDASDTGRSH